MLTLLLLAVALQPLERLEGVEISLSRQCKPSCPLLLKAGRSELAVADLALPRATAVHENGQWTIANVVVSLQGLRLGAQVAGVLIGAMRVPEGEGLAMGAWRLVALAGGELKRVFSFADQDAMMGLGQATMVDQVLHFTHDSSSAEDRADEFDDTAWAWAGEMRKLDGATLFALAVAAAPSLAEARKAQHEIASRCRALGSLRAYSSARFEGIPQAFFAGKIFLRRSEAQAALQEVRACAPTAEVLETAYLRP